MVTPTTGLLSDDLTLNSFFRPLGSRIHGPSLGWGEILGVFSSVGVLSLKRRIGVVCCRVSSLFDMINQS